MSHLEAQIGVASYIKPQTYPINIILRVTRKGLHLLVILFMVVVDLLSNFTEIARYNSSVILYFGIWNVTWNDKVKNC